MIKLIVHNHYTNQQHEYDIEKMYDFDKLITVYGPSLAGLVGQFKNVRSAADAVAEYLSNNHMEVEVIDPEDNEEIYDPNVEMSNKQHKAAEAAIDLKEILENYDQAQLVDIPEMHTLASATHRWNK